MSNFKKWNKEEKKCNKQSLNDRPEHENGWKPISSQILNDNLEKPKNFVCPHQFTLPYSHSYEECMRIQYEEKHPTYYN